jgi:magnesium transporter
MLKTVPDAPPHGACDGAALHEAATWIDLLHATDAERRLVEQTTGLHVPDRAELDEIETSSRLYRSGGALHLSTPVVRPGADGAPEVTPLGFVLSAERLVSIRFVELPSFDALAASCRAPDAETRSSAAIFAGILEGVIERLADVLERVGTDLDRVSHQIFHAAEGKRGTDLKKGRATRGGGRKADRALRAVLRGVGQAGDLISKLRDTLLAIGRMVPFVIANAAGWLDPRTVARLEVVRDDIRSLGDYDGHLSNKVQFLLDATLGFINIEQNEIVKVLTVVSVVGVPPTLVASMYGMNFKNIPEYDWAWGYEWGLLLIVGSAVASLLWFKLRGWL